MRSSENIDYAASSSSVLGRLNFYWRLVATGLSFLLFAMGGVLIISLPSLVLMVLPITSRHRIVITRHLISRVFLCYIYLMKGLGLLTFEIHGLELLENRGQLVIANHPSLIDVVFLIALIRKADCVVKHSLSRNLLTMAPVRSAGYLRNDDPKLLEHSLRTLQEGNSLIVFPEGERSRPNRALHFLRGAAHIALNGGHDITPVLIECDPPNLLKHQPWHHIPEQRPHWKITVLPTIQINPFLQASEWPSQQARQLTGFLQRFYTEKLKKTSKIQKVNGTSYG